MYILSFLCHDVAAIHVYCFYRVCVVPLFFFFFKQKTAYEMRISDWSSDVCSSDLEFEGKRGLTDQHVEPIDDVEPAHFGGLEKTGLERRIDEVVDDRILRKRRQVEGERWLAFHAEAARIDEQRHRRKLCIERDDVALEAEGGEQAHRLQRRAIEDRHLADVRARKREEHRARRAARADDCDSSTFEIEFGERGIKARGVGVDRKSTRLTSRH